MEIIFKIFPQNGKSFLERIRTKKVLRAISDALWLIRRNDYKKINIYQESTLIATIYGFETES